MTHFRRLALILSMLALLSLRSGAQVVINEIHYHPVELEAFTATGAPVLDLTDDVHEFVEIHNTGAVSMDLSGWRFTDGISYTFPVGSTIPAGGFRVIAKNVSRLQTVYGISGVLGPFSGKLSNNADNIRLRDASGAIVDSVSYSAGFPWAQSADGLGANRKFLGFSFLPYQYRGRSLERVSVTGLSNDPANWLASPLSPGPSPGAANAVTRAVPKPVVVAINVFQEVDESAVIRASQPVHVSAVFSGSSSLSNVHLEWFVDDIESFAESRQTIPMADTGLGQYSTVAAIPGLPDRSVVRYRIRAHRGDGDEVVSPRADDPQLTRVGNSTFEGWHGYFVQPVRPDNGRVDYDFFISTADLTILDNNISQNPRRILSTGYPRDEPFIGYYTANPAFYPQYNPANYPAPGQPEWNGVVPAIFAKDGVVYDILARYHGSRYRRSASLNSWKFTFPRCKMLDGTKQRLLVTEKNNDTVLGYALFHKAGLPAAYSQFVDFYRNSDATGIRRCEISDNDEEMIKRFQQEEILRNPQNPPAFTGEGVIYKSKGLNGNEGPYGWAAGQKIPAAGVWSEADRYIWSYPIQNSDWRGHIPFRAMLVALWGARGDESRLSYPNNYSGDPTNFVNQDSLRNYFNSAWDKEKLLKYMAIRNWMAPWDDKFHNYLVYQQGDGKWTMLPWDFDSEMAGNDPNTSAPTNSIFAGKMDDGNGSYSNNSRGPNWFKDSILRAYDDSTGINQSNEFRRTLFILNNTLLSPASVAEIALEAGAAVPSSNWVIERQASVNSQLGLGPWYAPGSPVNLSPANNSSALPGASFTLSAYTHSNPTPVAHARTRWELRAASGSYAAPIYHVESTTNLTSLPIPFQLLTLGQSYRWRATYIDANGHPSAPSAETGFGFGPAPSTVTLLPISAGAPWKYNQTSAFNYPVPAPAPNSPSWWASTAYNDSTWPSGDPLFGVSTSIALPPNIRTSLTHGRVTYYFRRTFQFPGSPVGSSVRATRWIDDGCVVYINGVEVPELRTRMGTGTPNYSTFATSTVGTAAAEGPIDVPASYFVQGTNTIAVEVHQATSNSSDIVFALGLEADIVQASGDVVLNEVLASNRTAVNNGGTNPDYVELFNATASPVDIGGWNLTDNILIPSKFTFPQGTIIPAGGYLIVWCDTDFAAPGLHAGFKISANGQTVALIQGANVKDFVTFGPQITDRPIGRVGGGLGAWTLVEPSPGAPNAGVALGSSSGLKVNEWMASPAVGEDWFELYNSEPDPVSLAGLYLSDTLSNPTITQIPPLSFIDGHGFTRFEADGSNAGGNRCNFRLSASGESLVISAANGITLIDSVTFGASASNVSYGRLPDGAPAIMAFPNTATPGASNFAHGPVVISEALSNSSAPFEDAIELHNPTGASVNISGWWLSDNPRMLQKFRIPDGTSIPPGGYKVYYEADFSAETAGNVAFSLSALGEFAILSSVDGGGNLTGYRAQVEFGASASNVSFGRVPVLGGLEFWPQVSMSFGADGAATVAEFRQGPGAPNAAPRIGPVIINEVMYHPPDGPGGVDNPRDEFIELHNITTSVVGLAGWRILGDSDYIFPPGSTIRPGDYILIVGFDPADTATLGAFRSHYGLDVSVPVFGPFTPKLANSTHKIELAYPGPPTGSQVPFIMVDRIVYLDGTPWPAAADGSGPSLQRNSRAVIGNDPGNWSASSFTPGRVNTLQTPILDNDGDGMPNDWETANGLDPFSAADASLDHDGDGMTNLEEYLAGTDPRDASSVLRAIVTRITGGYRVHFTAQPGRSYSVVWRGDLSPGPWTKVADVPAQGAAGAVFVDDLTGESQRFYRVITPAAP